MLTLFYRSHCEGSIGWWMYSIPRTIPPPPPPPYFALLLLIHARLFLIFFLFSLNPLLGLCFLRSFVRRRPNNLFWWLLWTNDPPPLGWFEEKGSGSRRRKAARWWCCLTTLLLISMGFRGLGRLTIPPALYSRTLIIVPPSSNPSSREEHLEKNRIVRNPVVCIVLVVKTLHPIFPDIRSFQVLLFIYFHWLPVRVKKTLTGSSTGVCSRSSILVRVRGHHL